MSGTNQNPRSKKAKRILDEFLEALKMSDSSPIDFKKVIKDILFHLAMNEKGKDEKLKKELKSPVCHICGFHTTVDNFVSECWMYIETEEAHNQHGDKAIWICPDCIAKKANVS